MSNNKWSCFDCRSTYNREHRKCPKCGSELHFMGKYFKPPKRTKDKEWEAIEMLIDAGVVYIHDRDGERPCHPKDVAKFLQLRSERIQQLIRQQKAYKDNMKSQ